MPINTQDQSVQSMYNHNRDNNLISIEIQGTQLSWLLSLESAVSDASIETQGTRCFMIKLTVSYIYSYVQWNMIDTILGNH